MATLTAKPLGQVLKDLGILTEYDIQETLRLQKEKGGAIGQLFVQQGLATEDDVNRALAMQRGMDFVDLDKAEILPEVIDLVDANTAETFMVMPLEYDGTTLTVAVARPDNLSVLDDLRFTLPKVSSFKAKVSSEESIKRAFQRYYQKGASMEDLFSGVGKDVQGKERASLEAQVEMDPNAGPVVKHLNKIHHHAIPDRASDIHLEPFEHEFKVRYRVDGVLYEMMPPPVHLARAVISRVKVMSSLDIAETRLPQDGRIELNIGGNPVDLRVSTLPTMFGESVVLRVLDRSNLALDLEKLGFRPDELKAFRGLCAKPNGIILVTGPTGSGKTTTLYSALYESNTIDVKIITTEDPVEYDLEGIVQVQINEDIEVTFANCLRSILRQDPDKILVGEIRDLETAQIDVEYSLTGHIVFSTLHTNDAPSAVTRMLDLGLEPFLLTATVEGIIAQRLVRRICLNCKEPYEPSDEEIYELELTPTDVEGRVFYYGKGCKKCNNTGYRGRVAIFELLIMNDRLRAMIMNHASTADVRNAAKEDGMRTLRDSGLLHIYDGVTTIEEVVKETIATV
ncbi:MAG: Flp pilus assembly complex ATPase component TadA [Planctomycetes bacterium]|nr:Flp pilus assembly complex ATPase component TadA [Planctomycetota bacterium]